MSTSPENERVLIFDFGAQYAQLIARRVREQNVFCQLVRHDLNVERVKALKPAGIILSGHTDTVPWDGQAWTVDPLSGIVQDWPREEGAGGPAGPRLYGRGSADMKAFIAVALANADRFLESDSPFAVHLALSYDEEVGCFGVRELIADMKEAGVKPVAVEAMATTDKDVTAQLRSIQRAGADVLLTQIHPAPIAIVVKQARQLGLTIPHVASNALILPSTLGLVDGPDVDGVYVETVIVPAADPSPKIQDWLKRYQARFGKPGDHFALLQYDITYMLAKALEEAGAEPTPDALQAKLRSLKYEGLVTLYESDDEGNLNHLVSIYRLDAAKKPELKDRFRIDPKR